VTEADGRPAGRPPMPSGCGCNDTCTFTRATAFEGRGRAVNGPGPQRVIQGQGGELFYTPDHYGTFIPLN